MTQQRKLEKLIQKAVDNGWKASVLELEGYIVPESFIFSHDFARCLWGLQFTNAEVDIEHRYDGVRWQYYIQQMVLANDPVSYAYTQVFGKEEE